MCLNLSHFQEEDMKVPAQCIPDTLDIFFLVRSLDDRYGNAIT
jgi:hypothetical protein